MEKSSWLHLFHHSMKTEVMLSFPYRIFFVTILWTNLYWNDCSFVSQTTWNVPEKMSAQFIWPFGKRSYSALTMSVRPSVCLSVRPSFPDFLQHALRYQFETWYLHSVGGTTSRVWVSFQLGHFNLLYSQNLVKLISCNHGLINQAKSFKLFHMFWYIDFKLREYI